MSVAIALSDSLASSRTKLSARDTVNDAGLGDSSEVACQKLSPIEIIEMSRKDLKIFQKDFVVAAGTSLRTYARHLRRPEAVPDRFVLRMQAALRRLEAGIATSPRNDEPLARAAYAAALERTSRFYGVTPEQVWATSPQAGATAHRHWRACSHARQAALYLAHTGCGVAQKLLASLLGVTPAAVCLALKDVEDRRDDPAFNHMLNEAMRLIAGRDE